MKYHQNLSLREYNTFQIEARADHFYQFEIPEELQTWLKQNTGRSDVLVLGGGSNILFTGDYSGTILYPVFKGKEIIEEKGDDVWVRIAAGEDWDQCVEWAVNNDLWGLENLSLIPGHAGAAPVQNIGAYGVEISELVEWIEGLWLKDGKAFRMTQRECDYGYRHSIFKGPFRNQAVITSVVLKLSRKPFYSLNYGTLENVVTQMGGPTLKNIRQAVMQIRYEKLPDPRVTGNAGSFFKNPVVEKAFYDELKNEWPGIPGYILNNGTHVKIPAGWLIEQVGWKGKILGNAGVHFAQALVLINRGGATGSEIASLAGKIQQDVVRIFGIQLMPEVNIL